tara:strand:+ start:1319 stop:1843 length:525 start_codon:yes stop_codon:yes gene_type:complete
MSTSHFEEESNRLKAIINKELNIDIMENTRERTHVDSRMLYSLVLKKRGYSYSQIGRSIKKSHSTVIHYLRDIDVVMSQLPALRKTYERISSSHSVKYDPVYDMDSVELRSHIYELRDSIDSLSLQLKETKNDLAVCENSSGRLSKIFYILKERVPKGKEDKLQSKLITLINGL